MKLWSWNKWSIKFLWYSSDHGTIVNKSYCFNITNSYHCFVYMANEFWIHYLLTCIGALFVIVFSWPRRFSVCFLSSFLLSSFGWISCCPGTLCDPWNLCGPGNLCCLWYFCWSCHLSLSYRCCFSKYSILLSNCLFTFRVIIFTLFFDNFCSLLLLFNTSVDLHLIFFLANGSSKKFKVGDRLKMYSCSMFQSFTS